LKSFFAYCKILLHFVVWCVMFWSWSTEIIRCIDFSINAEMSLDFQGQLSAEERKVIHFR